MFYSLTYSISLLSFYAITFLLKSVEGIIIVPLAEEQSVDTPLANLRNVLDVPIQKYPNVQFKILQQHLTLVRSSPRVSSASPSTWVTIDTTSGILRQNERVDRETLCRDVRDCYIEVKIILLPQNMFRFETLQLRIIDINDNPPSFPSGIIDTSVPETSKTGDKIDLDKYQATDPDSGNNSAITYSLSPPNEHFQILQFWDENQNPHLQLNISHILDYEQVRVHRVTIRARDMGKPSLYKDVELRVNVIDENDNSPVFEKEKYDVIVKESLPTGQDIALVRAIDRDGGRRGNVYYSIQSSSGTRYPVVINNITGAVKLCEKLDHKRHDGMQVLVEAHDGDVENPKRGTTILLLHVEDVNDHAPVITINYIILNQDNNVYVNENQPIGTFLARVSAADADQGVNGEVTVSVATIVPGTQNVGNITELGYFYITEDKLLATEVKLDREKRGYYDVIISATDNGKPALTTTKNVRIVVLDVNEFKPVFQHPDFEFYFPENKNVGSQIAVAKALDRDAENSPAWRLSKNDEIEPSLNGDITYGINLEIDDESSDGIPVSIDSVTGKVTLIRSLDYETKKSWTFVITARDNGRPVALQSTCKMKIDVGNINDNKPTFVHPSSDNTTVYASTIMPSKVFIRIKALDFGVDEDTELIYSFRLLKKNGLYIDQQKYNGLFQLDRTTGKFELKTSSYSEEEILGVYTATIYTMDSGKPPLQTSMTLYINVINTIPPTEPQTSKNDDVKTANSSSTLIVIGVGIGGLLVIIIVILAAVFCARKKQRNGKHITSNDLDEEAESLSATTPSDGQPVLTVRTRGVVSSSNSQRQQEGTCCHAYNTSSTQRTSLSNMLGDSCKSCDFPKSPKGMQKFIEQQQAELRFTSLSPTCTSWTQEPLTSLNLSPDCSEEKLLPSPSTTDCQDTLPNVGEHCTEMCKRYGHSDSCWMPATEQTALIAQLNPTHLRSPWQQTLDTSRKDSGCSVDTASSALSYYKMTKSDPNRHNDVFVSNEVPLPDVVGKHRTIVNSDTNSMMSSTTSSGASGSRHSGSRLILSPQQKSQNPPSLKKSNNEYGDPDATAAGHKHALPSLSTEC